MIVISGALVLVALVLLVLGLTMTDLNFVYGSIAVSLISFVFLVIGILQRRGEQPADAAAGGPEVTQDGAEPAAVEPAAPAKAGTAGSIPVTADADDEPQDDWQGAASGGPTVLVVPGRPRYHVEGCRYLTGKAVEEVGVDDAREQYSPCGVCKPDDVLAALSADAGVDGGDQAAEEVVEEPVEQPAPRARRAASPRTGRSTSTRTARSTSGSRPARKATAAGAAGSTAAVTVDPPDPAVATEPEATEALEAPAAAVAPEAPAPSTARRKVVVIPDRGRFHTADCRFVRDALGTEELSRTAATRQGYKACGVCKP